MKKIINFLKNTIISLYCEASNSIQLASYNLFALNLLSSEIHLACRYFEVLVKYYLINLVPWIQGNNQYNNLVFDFFVQLSETLNKGNIDLTKKINIDFDTLWSVILGELFKEQTNVLEICREIIELFK